MNKCSDVQMFMKVRKWFIRQNEERINYELVNERHSTNEKAKVTIPVKHKVMYTSD